MEIDRNYKGEPTEGAPGNQTKEQKRKKDSDREEEPEIRIGSQNYTPFPKKYKIRFK